MRHVTAERRKPSQFVALGRKRARYEMNTRYAGLPGYVAAEPVAEYIDWLAGLGLPMASIARDAGCGEGAVVNIHRRLWPTTRIRYATAIRAVSFRPNERQQIVIAVGAIRRAQALHAIGWTWRAIEAHAHGVTAANLSRMTSPRQGRTVAMWSTWAAIRDVYELLSGTPAPKSNAATKARRTAEKHGWPAPLDWEGLDIDDPRVTAARSGPPKVTQRTRAADRRERARELLELGLSVEITAARLGVTVRQVERYIREAKSEDAA